MKKYNNYAFIDGANLYNGVKSLSWKFDYGRFRIWLTEKYKVDQAYLFLGMMPQYNDLYTELRKKGYLLVFREVIFDHNGKAKGNCDADIVVQAMQNAYENKFNKAILVTSDGDYSPLVKFLLSKQKMHTIISPYETKKCSVLLKRTGVKISHIHDQKNILEAVKEKAPDLDGTR